MPGSRVLVTGVHGYLGGRLVPLLAKAGIEVIALGHSDADLGDAAAVQAGVRAAGKLDAVLHLAAANELVCAKDPRRAFDINCLGTRVLAESAAACGVRRLIYFSTFHVYGEPTAGAVVDERTVPDPLHPYGITKLVGEQFCKAVARQRGLELAILRLSNGIGPPASPAIDRWSLLVLDLCRQAYERSALTVHSAGLQLRDFVSIDDVHQALRLVLEAPAAALADPVFNVGGGACVPVREIADLVRHEFERRHGRLLPLRLAEPAPGETTRQFQYSIDKLRALGYRPTTDLAREIDATLQFCETFKESVGS